MRVIHTAGLRLDACYAATGYPAPFGQHRREELRAVTAAIIRRAAQWPADLVLVTGNLFEADRVSLETVKWLADTFATIAPTPIVVTPGPSDPWTDQSPYRQHPWPENVHIVEGGQWLDLRFRNPGFLLHAYGWTGDDTALPPNDLDVYKKEPIILAACSPQSPPGWIDAAEARYFALGHDGESAHLYREGDSAVGMAGPPQGHGFDEQGTCHYLEVEFDADTIQVDAVPSSESEFVEATIDIHEFPSTDDVLDAIAAIKDATLAAPIARVILEGPREFTASEWMAHVHAHAEAPFEHLEILDETYAAENYQTLANQPTPLGAFLTRMNKEIADAPDTAHRRKLIRARSLGLAALRGETPALPEGAA